jgi:hypothetical protein
MVTVLDLNGLQFTLANTLLRLCLRQPSAKGFQSRMLTFLWVPEISPCLRNNSRHTPTQLLLNITMPLKKADSSKIEAEVTIRLTVSQSVCFGSEHPWGIWDQILFPVRILLSEISGLVSMGRPFWWEDESAICSVITQWSESLRTWNITLLFHLRLPQPGGPASRIYIPQEEGGQVISPYILPLTRKWNSS